MWPGPKTTASMPAAAKSAASVQKPRSAGGGRRPPPGVAAGGGGGGLGHPDAAVARADPQAGGLAHDGARDPARPPAGEESADARVATALLVAREQHAGAPRQSPLGRLPGQRLEDGGD